MISHKLKEITAIADTTTILRDGQTVEKLDMRSGEVSEERIIHSMVGRVLENRFPERSPNIGEEVLRIENWSVFHPLQAERQIVRGANMSLRRGEIVGLAGLMGAGRTELAMSIFGRSYGQAIEGTIYKDGQAISTETVTDAIANGIAYATEDRRTYGLNLIDNVKRNISAAALDKISAFGWINDNEETRVAEEYRKSLNIRTPSVASLTGQLSGGNQQKVVLSKWIYADPDVLILDEPTRGIDVGAKYEIYNIIHQLAEQGKAILMISSELEEILGICDRIYALSAGRITGEVSRKDASQERLMEFMTKEEN